MSTYTLLLPWPKPPLSLNDRGQTTAARMAKSAKAKRIRHEVMLLARAARLPACHSIHVRLHYRQPDRRRRDADNLIATQKPCIDALVDAGVIPDDCAPHLDWSMPALEPPVKGQSGALWLVITDTSGAAL